MSYSIVEPSNTQSYHRRVTLFLTLVLGVSLISCSKREAKTYTASNKQLTFASPAAAGAALFEAAKVGDQKTLLAIFGPNSRDILSSGDAVKDKDTLQRFVSAYSRMNRWSKVKSGEEILYVGVDNFPFPIPLDQNAAGQWGFNTDAGRDEILARRIGNGELTAIGVLTEIVRAQQQYFAQNHRFAEKLLSDEGRKNGLYWPAVQNQSPSPLAGLVDLAKALGYTRADKVEPFDGYYYKMLPEHRTRKSESGGASNSFAVLAWPAKYRDSGIMTFVVSQDGVVYQKDLGDKTSETVVSNTFKPSGGWTVVLTPESPAKTENARIARN